MANITKEEIEYLERDRFRDFRSMNKKLWTKAFDDYNTDHEKDRPLTLHCRICYMKVFTYLKLKYASVLNN